MEFKTDALLLRAVDYGEYDKIVTLLTADRGKIAAAMKGVKKAGAKLRFAAQPFCFAEYVFAARGGRNTVTSAALHDGFYALCEDVTRYYAAAVVTETCDRLSLEGMQAAPLLVAAVTALEGLCADEPLALLLAAAAFNVFHELAAGEGHARDARFLQNFLICTALYCGDGAQHRHLFVARNLYRPSAGRLNHAYDGYVRHGARAVYPDGRGVAGDDYGLYPARDEIARDLFHAVAYLFRRLGAVGTVSLIGHIDKIFAREHGRHALQNGKSADTGVEHPYRLFGFSH